MAGRIVEEDLAQVRERARIDEVIGSYMTLRRAGGDLTGLCPFHDEKTPSFHVSPSRGLFYCFGCGVGGDVIRFVQQIDNLTFLEAVQALADRVGVTLRFEDAAPSASADSGMRQRLLAANQSAAEFFAAQLLTPEGVAARQMLDSRGFDKTVAQQFGVGYAPRSGQALHEHLRTKGFRDDELVKANLIRANGGWDVFQGRVLWPIRDSTAVVLGFGARRLFEDDKMPGKYVNTSETPIYKKSKVLYGLDMARGTIGKAGEAVVMEGYTDVMAAHLSGVNTAVASCGTSFGEDHARLLQRIIGLPEQGRVVFTFDGDEAGQKAALKAFELADKFAVPTYVAVAPDGLDPCDLRLQRGDTAVRELVRTAAPLYEFVMRNRIAGFDLDRRDSRVDAVRAIAPILGMVGDPAKRSAFIAEVAGLVGMEPAEVRRIIGTGKRRGKAGKGARTAAGSAPGTGLQTPGSGAFPTPGDDALPSEQPADIPYPPPNEPSLAAERGVCQLMLQAPAFFTTDWCGLDPQDFRHPAYRAICEVVMATPFEAEGWIGRLQAVTASPTVLRCETELAVAPLMRPPDEAYVRAYAARVRLGRLMAQLETLRSRLQRMNPITDAEAHVPLFQQVVQMEALKVELKREALGVAP